MTVGSTTTLTVSGRTLDLRSPEAAPRKYLPELQGLRALAVLMVVAYHVWFGRISGGVDIFLLISAFLLTRQFTQKLEAGRTLELLKYWVHLFKRLLPLVVVVLLATLGATYLLLPETRWQSIFAQAWASLFYFQNWFLASEAVDYYAADHSVASPLQHIWSLSIQGQIFILWPLIFAVAGVTARLARVRIRPLLICIFAAVFAVSLLFSISTTASSQAFAYFDTRTRLWEFALGSLLALALPYLQLRRSVRIGLGWLGIAAMFSCGLILQVGQQFPGYMALWPTLAAACIIVAGDTGSKSGADRFLRWKPLVKLGESSYALYLVHWPLLIFFLVVSGRQEAGLAAGSVIIFISLVAAGALTRWIEAPLRSNTWFGHKRRRALAVVLVCISLVAVPLGSWQFQLQGANRAAQVEAARNSPGAASLQTGFVSQADPGAPPLPALNSLPADEPAFPRPCFTEAEKKTYRCSNGITDGARHIVVLGSSHANVWNTPIMSLAQDNDWTLTSIIKGLCPVGTSVDDGLSEECVEFNAATLAEVRQMKPDLVVTTSTRTDHRAEMPERLDESWVTEIKALNLAGIPVLALRDTPRFAESVPVCIENNLADPNSCGVPKTDIFSAASPTDAVAAELPDTTFLDFTDYFCLGDVCPAVIGNVIVYKDSTHVTASYMATLTPILKREFQDATGWPVE